MQEENLIPANEFCLHHNIGVSFLYSLQEYGLIEIASIEKNLFIDTNQVSELEKMIRLHYELNINFEGIDAIWHLLERLEQIQDEMMVLRNRLRMYETGG